MGGYDYVYQYKDHLGNIRLSYVDNSGTLEIVEENNYYPFGLTHKGYNSLPISPLGNSVAQKWKYNGVELDETSGLYEMGARMMDPAIGRFISLDPMADFVNHQSPYAMANNNPVANVDEYGLGILNVIGNLFKRLGRGIDRLVNGKQCSCDAIESIADAFERPDFPNSGRSNGRKPNKPSKTVKRERKARTGNTSGIASVGVPNDFTTTDFGNINSSSSKLRIPIIEIGPKPIPILGGNPVIVPTRINFSGNDGTVLDVNDNINNRTLNAIVKTLQDYPQIKMHIYVNLLQKGSGTNKEAEEGRYRKAVGRRAAAIIKFFENQGIDINRIDWSIDSMRQINNPNSIDVRRRVNNQRFMLINKNED